MQLTSLRCHRCNGQILSGTVYTTSGEVDVLQCRACGHERCMPAAPPRKRCDDPLCRHAGHGHKSERAPIYAAATNDYRVCVVCQRGFIATSPFALMCGAVCRQNRERERNRLYARRRWRETHPV